MQAEIISIGDELTSGQRLDTNSQWLAQRLTDLGIRVVAHSTITDDLAINIETFRLAARRSHIILCTGGLGPTQDDLTREAFAEAFELPLETYPEELAYIESLFQRRQRPMPERNKVQALFPRGSRVIPNPHGTAPGIDLVVSAASDRTHQARFFALPGVPAEMRQMWDETVAPRLIAECGAGERQIHYAVMKCFGIGESEVEVRMPDLIRRDRVPRVGITASRATITLRIAAEGDSHEACRQQMLPTIEEIRQRLGAIVFAEMDEELPDTILKKLAAVNQSLATIEVGNAALLGHWLADAQTRQLGTPSEQPRPYRGSLHLAELAVARFLFPNIELNNHDNFASLAQRWREYLDVDWVVMVGPYPWTSLAESSAVATAQPNHFIVAGRESTQSQQIVLSGHPDVLHYRIAKTALDHLRYSLLSSSS
jgi:nicotinamide-nucleotide amidase